jgi:uncharacterized SAM-dependent methyltransferase
MSKLTRLSPEYHAARAQVMQFEHVARLRKNPVALSTWLKAWRKETVKRKRVDVRKGRGTRSGKGA